MDLANNPRSSELLFGIAERYREAVYGPVSLREPFTFERAR